MKGGWTRSHLRQWWWIAFVLGAFMINYPFLQIFNRPAQVFGFPLLFLYFILGWAASIAAIAFYAWALVHAPPDDDGEA